jgi:hypothetical protein
MKPHGMLIARTGHHKPSCRTPYSNEGILAPSSGVSQSIIRRHMSGGHLTIVKQCSLIRRLIQGADPGHWWLERQANSLVHKD